MARKDIIESAHHRLERFKEESPGWLEKAREALSTWNGHEEYLVTAVARAMKASFDAGRAGHDEPEPEQEEKPVTVRVGRSRPAPITTRQRRTRS